MRKTLDQSFPFVAEKSETTYRLVEIDGKCLIEKVTVSTSTEVEIPDDANASQLFREFILAKQAHRERNKKRISAEDAFIKHHVHQHSWQQIADEVGQKSGASIGKRVLELTNGLAHQYLQGTSIHQLVGQLDITPNHLHSILVNALERERSRLLNDYESGSVMRSFARDVDRVVEITNFLDDWDSFEYQVVSPFRAEDTIARTNKKILYTEDFYEFHRSSGKVSRVSVDVLDGATFHNWNSSHLVEAFGLIEADPIVVVFDMFGKRSDYYTKRLSNPSSQ